MSYLKTVAYVPLDDRPCNKDRVKYAAQAMGMEILFPPLDYYKNCLDDQPVNSTGSQLGSPDLIMDWLRNISQSRKIDAYLISLDQINSGGLIGARSSRHSENIDKELARVKEMLRIIGNTPAYYFDVILRLATTLGFEGNDHRVYDGTYQYGSVPRRKITSNSYFPPSEAIPEIIRSYKEDVNRNIIDPRRFNLTQSEVDKYLKVRARKFRLNHEVGRMINDKSNSYLVYAVGDCNGPDTIQKNEIDLINTYNLYGADHEVFAGIDEVAICLLSKIATDLYNNKPVVKVRYYGGAENDIPENWDFKPLYSNIETHITISGGRLARGSEKADLELLVLTKPKTGTQYSNANDLHWQANYNNDNNILTAIIDASKNADGNYELEGRLFDERGNRIKLSKLLAYSSWNTIGNAIGMALGHAIGRAAFFSLGFQPYTSRYALEGQVKLLFTELFKDISYRSNSGSIDTDLIRWVTNQPNSNLTPQEQKDIPWNFYKHGIHQDAGSPNWEGRNELLWASFAHMTRGRFNINKLANLFIGGREIYESYLSPSDCGIAQINWINYPYENGDSIWFPLEYPWHRTFECTFPLAVSFK